MARSARYRLHEEISGRDRLDLARRPPSRAVTTVHPAGKSVADEQPDSAISSSAARVAPRTRSGTVPATTAFTDGGEQATQADDGRDAASASCLSLRFARSRHLSIVRADGGDPHAPGLPRLQGHAPAGGVRGIDRRVPAARADCSGRRRRASSSRARCSAGLTALLSLGLALVYRANRIVNFAQGDLGAVPAASAVLLIVTSGASWLVGLVAAARAGRGRGGRRGGRRDPPLLARAASGAQRRDHRAGTAARRPRACCSPSGSTRACHRRASRRRSMRAITVGSVRFGGNEIVATVAVPLAFVALALLLRARPGPRDACDRGGRRPRRAPRASTFAASTPSCG